MEASRYAMGILLLLLLCVQRSMAEVTCENLPKEICAFSISGTGRRCVLEKFTAEDEEDVLEFQCKTSTVTVEKTVNYIESEDCIRACGADRNSVGISSDALLEPLFVTPLCSPSCFRKCPNIVDLYSSLAIAEGVSLREICDTMRQNPHRVMAEITSSGAVAEGPAASLQQKESL